MELEIASVGIPKAIIKMTIFPYQGTSGEETIVQIIHNAALSIPIDTNKADIPKTISAFFMLVDYWLASWTARITVFLALSTARLIFVFIGEQGAYLGTGKRNGPGELWECFKRQAFQLQGLRPLGVYTVVVVELVEFHGLVRLFK